jgi:hypothetical protein
VYQTFNWETLYFKINGKEHIIDKVSHQIGGKGEEKNLMRIGFDPPARIGHQRLTKSMQLSASREAASSAAIQKLPDILWNPKVHYRVQKALHWPLSYASSSQSIPPHPISLKIDLNIIIPSTSRSS